MKRMNAIGLMAVVLAIVVPATSAAAKTVKYRSTVVSNQLSTSNGYPGTGSTAVLAGSLTTGTFGPGAVVDRVRITGSPQPNVFTFTGSEVDFFAGGTLRNRLSAMDIVGPDGTQHVQVTGRYTGGTSSFRGATGHYRFTGTVAPGSTVLKGHSSGQVTF